MILPQTRGFGIVLVLMSAVLWSTGGLFVRMADLDLWSIVAWRSVFSFLSLGAFVLVRNRFGSGARGAGFGWPGIAASLVSMASAISYIASLRWTSVANVMTVYAALPFVTTAIAFLWMRERTSLRFVLAGLLAFAGISMTAGAAMSGDDVTGIAIAVFMTVTFAAVLVISKRFPTLDMTLAAACGAAAGALLAIPLMQTAIPEPHQMLACALYGILTTGVAYALILLGSRLVSPGETSLLSMLDVVLGPLWVWLAYGERVSPAGLAGGGVVLAAVVWYLSGELGRSAPAAACPPIPPRAGAATCDGTSR